jgi:hypothetical protein
MSLIIAVISVLVVGILIARFYPNPKKTEDFVETKVEDPTPTPSWVNEIKFETEVLVTPEPSVVEKIVKKVTKPKSKTNKKPAPKMSNKKSTKK